MSDQYPPNHPHHHDNHQQEHHNAHHHHDHDHPHPHQALNRKRRHHGRHRRGHRKRQKHEGPFRTESGTELPRSPNDIRTDGQNDEDHSVASSYDSSIESWESGGNHSQASESINATKPVDDDKPDKLIPAPEVAKARNALIDWGAQPTVMENAGGELVGQPLPKPMGAFNPREVAEVANKNRRRILSNIRRKKIIIWMLIFSLAVRNDKS